MFKTKTLRLHPPTLYFLALLVQAALLPIAVRPAGAGLGIRLAGLAVLILGLAVSVIAERQFQRAGIPVRPGMRTDRLMTAGLYRWSRNPMYLGLAISLVGLALLETSPLALLPAAAFVGVIDRVIQREETALGSQFGEVFSVYRSRVRRWI